MNYKTGTVRGASPNINVTPLIDVLLVLLIIFMVISPAKPHKYDTRLPEKTPDKLTKPDVFTLVVTIPTGEAGYRLNQTPVPSLSELGRQLHEALDARPLDRKVVFLKAPVATRYGAVVDTIDVIKSAGGEPIGLQLEGLEN